MLQILTNSINTKGHIYLFYSIIPPFKVYDVATASIDVYSSQVYIDTSYNTHLSSMPIILTLSPASDWMPIIVSTISYKIAWPTFLLVSVLVAT